MPVLECDWTPRLTVLRYADFESARDGLQPGLHCRTRAARWRDGALAMFNMVLVEGETPM